MAGIDELSRVIGELKSEIAQLRREMDQAIQSVKDIREKIVTIHIELREHVAKEDELHEAVKQLSAGYKILEAAKNKGIGLIAALMVLTAAIVKGFDAAVQKISLWLK